MKKIVRRILLAVIAIPLLFSSVILLPHFNYLAINLIAILMSIITAIEVNSFFINKGFSTNKKLAPVLGVVIPIATYLKVCGIVSDDSFSIVLFGVCSILFIREIFIKEKTDFKNILMRITSSIFVLVYPGVFLSYSIRFSELPFPTESYILLMSFVFLNDSLAYAFGMLLGNNSRGFVLISPNKSIVGFIAGITGSVLVGILSWLIIPGVLSDDIYITVILSILIGIITILGDLAASALKRSAEMKDSGNLVPGRGGILDSIDSFIFTAPVLYYFLNLNF